MDINEDGFVDVLKKLPGRILGAVFKLAGVKGAIWGTATALLWFGKIEVWAWVAISLIVIFGREALKVLKDIR